MIRATELAHILMRRSLGAGDWAVDATVGNGHDTLMLAERVGPSGRVFGFDVQETALAATALRVEGRPQVTLIHAGHETLAEHLPSDGQARLAGAMFNLGYLPGGPRAVTTRTETTLAGLEQALGLLKTGGLVTLVLYPGHPGGGEEAAAVRSYVQGLTKSHSVARYARVGTVRPAPELVILERRTGAS